MANRCCVGGIGWKRERVFLNFIFAVQRGGTDDKVVVFEMKGEHLKSNDDTNYKREVLRLMAGVCAVEQTARGGEYDLMVSNGTEVTCDLVMLKDWKPTLPPLLSTSPP